MATSILGEIYKEAAATSKGVVKMNNTLTKIYDDQEKGNKRQDKFITTLTKQQRRAEREDKKRQSDLKKLIRGSSQTGAKGDKKDGLDLGDGFGGIVGAIIGGITKSLGVFKFALGALFTKKFAFLAGLSGALGLALRPITRGLTGGDNLDPIATGQESLPSREEVRQNQEDPVGTVGDAIKETPIVPTLEEAADSFTVKNNTFQKPGPIKGPIKAPSSVIKKGNIFTRGFRALKNAGKGLTKLLGKLAGPLLLIWDMKDTVIDLWQKKQYKNLTRYLLKTVLAYKIGGTVGSAAFALSGLLGLATGGTAAIPALILSTIAATSATVYSEKVIDKVLKDLGLYDDPQGMTDGNTTTDTSPDAAKVAGLTGKDLENANNKKGTIVDKLKDADAQQLATGGFAGMNPFTVPGSGQGDTYRTFLPEGSFVLNKVAAAEMFARGGSPSGMAPVILEPGERVFMPGDPLMDIAMAFNSSFSRFQRGGPVGGDSKSPSSSDASKLGGSGIMFKENANIKPGGHMSFIGDGSGFTGEIKLIDGGGQVVSRIGGVSGVASTAGASQQERSQVSGTLNPIPDGTYPLEPKTARHPGQTVGEWSAWVNNPSGQIGNRGQIFVHNDIGSNGTAGCIGIEAGGSRGSVNSMKFADMYDKVQPQHVKVNLSASEGNTYSPGGAAAGDSSDGGASSGGEGGEGGDGGGMFDAIGAALSPVTDAIGNMFGDGGVGSQLLGAFTSKLGSFASGIGEELKGVDTEGLMGKINDTMSQMSAGIAAEMKGAAPPPMKASHMPIAGALQRVKEIMDPEKSEAPTIVQLIPSGGEQEATLAGSANQNLPPGLSVRCSSWAAADYRNDRSLNCETP